MTHVMVMLTVFLEVGTEFPFIIYINLETSWG